MTFCVWCRNPIEPGWTGPTNVRCDWRWWRTHWWQTCASCCYDMHGKPGWRDRLASRRYAWWFRRHHNDRVTML